MRVLFATGSPADYMMPPLLGDEQINCGPDWKDSQAADGRVLSLSTTLGEYDLAAVAAKIPTAQAPDLVVCLVDAALRNLPRNLAAFSCPRVLLIADTHHLRSPLTNMARYMAAEPYDRFVLLYDRHHASFFHAAGFRNLYWFPGLTFPHRDSAVRTARQIGARSRKIAFVGQAGKHHPRRARLLETLLAKGVPVVQKSLPQAAALRFYGSTLMGFNASLNGDLNLRIFEILAVGGALLTDRLAPQSGFAQLFTDGCEVITYSSPEEMIERATQALARPVETKAIGTAGARWFDEHFNEEWRRSAFHALAFDGIPVPAFAFKPQESIQVFFSGDTHRLRAAALVYENVQELHREQETVVIRLASDTPAEVTTMFSTLPRLNITALPNAKDPDLTIVSKQITTIPSSRWLWCWDAQHDDLAKTDAKFTAAGFASALPGVAFYAHRKLSAPPTKGNAAQAAFDRGAFGEAINLAQQALTTNSGSVDALLVIARLSAQAGKQDLCEQALDSARQLTPEDPRIDALARELS